CSDGERGRVLMMTPHTSALFEEFGAGTLQERDALLDRLRGIPHRTPIRRGRSLIGSSGLGAGLFQRRDHWTATELLGPIERRLAARAASVYIRARLQKNLHHSDVLVLRCDREHQRRHPLNILCIHVCARVYQSADEFRRSSGSGPDERSLLAYAHVQGGA